MIDRNFFLPLALAVLFAGFGLTLVAQDSSSLDSTDLNGISWRAIGPTAFGGRIDDVEAIPENPNVIFVAAASGGIFRSTNNGVTWKPVFDEVDASLSIGDIAVAPSDPGIVWAGTGEPNNRQSSSWGSGVYRSLDNGETWKQMGLEKTHHIGRIVIHPSQPNIVFVAALGHLWGSNTERGLYRTRDGGKSWEKVLYINQDTGVVDVALEENGRVLYAAAYQRRRRSWGFVGGGPHGGLYRSLDGGDTWEKLGNGLPDGDTGRIGLSISTSHPNIVYAIVEHKEGGVFRSEDRGFSWKRVNEMNPRPMYYSQIRVDPTNPEKIWVLGSPLFLSIDGGKTFSSDTTALNIHVDHHALWIDPNDPDHLMLGNDGGLYFSYDGSRTWAPIDNLPIAQYYAIGLDGRDPYWIYGGTQDNGNWALPSRNFSDLGITNLDVINVAYGDGFYAAIDPRDHRLVYCESQSGRLYRMDMETLEEKGIRPVPENAEEEYRFNWSSPLILSPHNPDILYYGGNKLFRSADQGHSWTEVSPDLTLNQKWKELPVMGIERGEDTLSRDDGTSDFGTLTTLAESPLQEGLIYVGSDDGKVHITRDGGKNWTDLSDRFELPGPRWVSRVLPSSHQAGTAYVSFDGHQDDDFSPYIYKTDDFGQSWTSVSGNIPDGIVVNSLAEHHRAANLLFAGTEFGLYASVDGGTHWSLMQSGLPRVPVDDIIIHKGENDLVLGTHGRGIYILDDLAFLEAVASETINPLTVIPIRTATQRYQERSLPRPGASTFSGPNPPPGALISYYLRDDVEAASNEDKGPNSEAQAKVEITILDGDDVIREMPGPATAGFHRVNWDLRHNLSYTPGKDEDGWFGPPTGHFVLPGQYTVEISAGELESTQTIEVRADPRMKPDMTDLKVRHQASSEANQLLGTLVRATKLRKSMLEEVQAIEELLKERTDLQEIRDETAQLKKTLEGMEEFFKSGWTSTQNKIADLLGQLQASTSKPTEAQMRALHQLDSQVSEKVGQINTLATKSLPTIMNQLRKKNVEKKTFEPVDKQDLRR